ncbi:putative defense protein Hdd11 [Periplaneta americana]|uniref:putative defense protein Hdd11 n=1 Tax=Periplaneta americana TaxID=6978 RepID=UPI0037E8C5AA
MAMYLVFFSMTLVCLASGAPPPTPDGCGPAPETTHLNQSTWTKVHTRHAYPVCIDMFPRHPKVNGTGCTPAQNSTPPYIINTTAVHVPQGGKVGVSVSGLGNASFRALYVQARYAGVGPENYTALGQFNTSHDGPGKVVTLTCSDGLNNSALFYSPELVNNATLTWIAPNISTNVVFLATVALSYDTFWVGVQSDPVSIGNP